MDNVIPQTVFIENPLPPKVIISPASIPDSFENPMNLIKPLINTVNLKELQNQRPVIMQPLHDINLIPELENNGMCKRDTDCEVNQICFEEKCRPICHDVFNPCPVSHICSKKGWCEQKKNDLQFVLVIYSFRFFR